MIKTVNILSTKFWNQFSYEFHSLIDFLSSFYRKEMSTIQSNVEYLTNRIISNDRINVKNSTIEEIKPKPIEGRRDEDNCIFN